jgi:phosphogluconate dehydratase
LKSRSPQRGILGLGDIVPSMTRIYPNGEADINAFHDAGGTPFLIRELLSHVYLHNDVQTVMGFGLERYTRGLR